MSDAIRPVIVIDPGHGGHDPGAVAGGTSEADIALEAAFMLSYRLSSCHGFETIMTRTRDVYVPLRQRSWLANHHNTAGFISLHCNAADSTQAHGFEVWTSRGEDESDPWASALIDQIKGAFPGYRIRREQGLTGPDKEAGFSVLVHTDAPAVLVEMGFITNAGDRGKLCDNRWLTKLTTNLAWATSVWYVGVEAEL